MKDGAGGTAAKAAEGEGVSEKYCVVSDREKSQLCVIHHWFILFGGMGKFCLA